ncbi:Y-family DNA polymerase [Corynebacterium uterequi]|uniref:DNA-directed DNA polymerase n=1 Tax=Corynebacterium uterequi TaxID=1072256 RepID=A0A0G3HAS0_9CORY|nr:DNA polymerase Y family protein [Corynebacterium uterequi]AKK10456.1 DNA-directed DNA polymerase [Corynebacterium uterequi]
MTAASARVAALWFPDWPVHAARLDGAVEVGADGLAAVAAGHRVRVCTQAARLRGVRRGMKIRQAQAVCPELIVADDDPERDGRVFAPMVDALDDVASSIEVLRPGLVIVDAGAAQRFHGEAALEMLVDAASARGVDTFVGVAGEIATAVIAARVGAVVTDSPAFLANQPVGVLAAEEALGCDQAVVDALTQLGVRTLGELAGVDSTAITTRFGLAGQRCHRIARGAPDRRVAPELPAPELSVDYVPEDPISRVDTAAFAARVLSARLHARLHAAGVSCQRLRVRVRVAGGDILERVWRTRRALSEDDTANRVRWQLDGWLSGGGRGEIEYLELTPLEVAEPEERRLFGSGGSREAAYRAISRVQSALGVDAVVQPRVVGGRGVAERVEWVPYGERRDDVRQASWCGQIPPPLPARLMGPGHPASRLRIVDADGSEVYVTAEALLSGEPYALSWGGNRFVLRLWAGPWPVDEAWWDPARARRAARMQVVAESAEGTVVGWLIAWAGGQWRVEAAYS